MYFNIYTPGFSNELEALVFYRIQFETNLCILTRRSKDEMPEDGKQHHDLWTGLMQKMEGEHLVGSRSNTVNAKSYAVVQEILEDLVSNQPDGGVQAATGAYAPKLSTACDPSAGKNNLTLFQVEEEKKDANESTGFKFENVSEPLTISFKGLNLFLKANHQKLLTNVSGVVKHSKITALMGPSGAG